MLASNITTPTLTMDTETHKIVASLEFDQLHGPKGKIQTRQTESNRFEIVLCCGGEEMVLLGATLDQWGTWYDSQEETFAAYEWGTRSFLDALIQALETMKAYTEPKL